MINDWRFSFCRNLGARPGRKAFDAGLRETSETVMKEAIETGLLFFCEYRLALSENGQPNGESVSNPSMGGANRPP
jgi:hypothetical protein